MTIPAPAGSDSTHESINPTKKQTTETIADKITTARNLENTRIDVSAGNMIRLEISIVPISLSLIHKSEPTRL